MAGDLDVLAGADYQGPDRGIRTSDLPVPGSGFVVRGVSLHAKEAEPVHGAGSDLRGVLADTAGERQRVQTAERRRHGGNAAAEPVQVDLTGEQRPLVARGRARQYRTHIGSPGQAQ